MALAYESDVFRQAEARISRVRRDSPSDFKNVARAGQLERVKIRRDRDATLQMNDGVSRAYPHVAVTDARGDRLVYRIRDGSYDGPSPSIQWQKTFGGSGFELAKSIRQTRTEATSSRGAAIRTMAMWQGITEQVTLGWSSSLKEARSSGKKLLERARIG
jgi:hypothetical protein